MENIIKNQSEKDRITEMKNNLQGINSRLDEAEDKISDLEYKEVENTQLEYQKAKRFQELEDNVRSLWDNFKKTNLHIKGVLEGEKREQEIKTCLKKIMTENFLNLVKEIDIQVQEAQIPKQDEPKEAHTKTHHN